MQPFVFPIKNYSYYKFMIREANEKTSHIWAKLLALRKQCVALMLRLYESFNDYISFAQDLDKFTLTVGVSLVSIASH